MSPPASRSSCRSFCRPQPADPSLSTSDREKLFASRDAARRRRAQAAADRAAEIARKAQQQKQKQQQMP
ncbi:hypothetical protein BH20ACT16_BH20ACT16_05960 [soil metagenome]|jgi:hypothetical protein